MTHLLPLWPRTVAVLCLAVPGAAQPGLDSAQRLGASCGLQRAGDGWLGLGPAYEAHLDGRSLTFVAALSAAAPRAEPVRFELLAYGRRDGALLPAGAVLEVAGAGRTVEYRRPGVTESYEMRPDGVKQSFAFASLPAGRGDLVVRGRIHTALPLRDATPDRLRFGDARLGGAFVRDVVGIGGDGVRATGRMHYADGVLELALPAAFVDTAALPLVLDPLFGASFEVAASPVGDDRDPDAAYHAGSDRYLVVWERRFALTGAALRGQLLDGSGNPVGGVIGIRESYRGGARPRVAALSGSDRFAVVWTENGNVVGRPVLTTGGLLGVFNVAVSLGALDAPDVTAVSTGDRAVVVWNDAGAGSIRARSMTFPPSMFGTVAVDVSEAPSGDAEPCISKGGADDRMLVVWSRDAGATRQVYGRLVGSLGGPFTGEFRISQFEDASAPAVDGDGRNWVVAYQARTTSGAVVNARPLSFSLPLGIAFSSGAVATVAGGYPITAGVPSVAWLGGSVLVGAGLAGPTGVLGAVIASIDPFDCATCEASAVVQGVLGRGNQGLRVASQWTGGAFQAGALAVWWDTDPVSGANTVRAQLYNGEDGAEVGLGGACGLGGETRATCARRGNGGFEFRVRNADPRRNALLVLSAGTLDLPCGGCQIVADPALGVVLSAGPTSPFGDALLPVPIPDVPSLVLRPLYAQWWVGVPGGSCLGFDLSDGMAVWIQ
ncbi:MAG: hypothetical protein AAF628_12140 [Planctomycetota bacterium]